MTNPRWHRRHWTLVVVLVVLAAAVAALAAASVSASPQPPPPEGTFRIGMTGAVVADRSGARVYHHRLAARVRDLREARQLPGRPWDEREASRLRPEIAAAMPTISAGPAHVHVPDPKRLRLLAAGERRRHRPEHEVHLRADAAPRHGLSGASQFLSNIDGATEYHNGHADEITGIVAHGDTLTITLIQPQGDFLTLLAMPFICAVPIGLPPVEQFAPIPSAGPYYISSLRHQRALDHQPESELPRAAAAALRHARVHFNLNEETAYQQVLSGELDSGPVPAADVQRGRPSCTAPTAPPRRAGFSSSSRSRQRASATPDEHLTPAVREREHAQGGELRRRPHGVRGPGGAVRGDTVRPVPPAGHARLRGHRRLSRSSGPRAGARPRRLASRRPAAADHRLLPLERDDQPGPVPDRPPEPDATSAST